MSKVAGSLPRKNRNGLVLARESTIDKTTKKAFPDASRKINGGSLVDHLPTMERVTHIQTKK